MQDSDLPENIKANIRTIVYYSMAALLVACVVAFIILLFVGVANLVNLAGM